MMLLFLSPLTYRVSFTSEAFDGCECSHRHSSLSIDRKIQGFVIDSLWLSITLVRRLKTMSSERTVEENTMPSSISVYLYSTIAS